MTALWLVLWFLLSAAVGWQAHAIWVLQRRRRLTGEDGPQETAAEAYEHAADMVATIAAKSRNQQLTAGSGPVFVRVERVEHLAAGLAARAEEARRA